MQEIIFLKGLPASGKTTWAIKFCQDNPNYRRINKDDIREELSKPFGESFKWNNEFEEEVIHIQQERGLNFLSNNFSIIVDDTNFSPKHEEYWREISKNLGVSFNLIEFTTSVEECIRRDKEREKSVGEGVILKMFNRYVKTKNILTDTRYILNQDQQLPSCIICDIDGTISLMNGRSPYDDKAVINDKLNDPVVMLLMRYKLQNIEIIYMSGRSEKARPGTVEWLKKNGLWFENQKLYMRPNGDFRKDEIIKKELFDEHIKDKYFIECVLDDRDAVVKMWRDLGLLCLQVYYGNF